MSEIINSLITFLMQGGSSAVISMLLIVLALLVWDRRQLVKVIAETTQRVYDAKDRETSSIKEIVDRYHRGSVDLVQALNEIKLVLVAIQSSRD